MMQRRHFATILFVIVLVFCAAEVIMIGTAKSKHDYDQAKMISNDLTVELSLISASFTSGDKTLFDDALARYQKTLDVFSENEYITGRQTELLGNLQEYRTLIESDDGQVDELLELSAAISGIRSELQSNESQKLDAANFYQIRQTFQNLKNVLDGIKSERFNEIKTSLGEFSQKIITLTESSATCVSVCPKSTFANKQRELESMKEKYNESFSNLGQKLSEPYDPSEMIFKLRNI